MLTGFLYAGETSIIELLSFLLFYGLVVCFVAAVLLGFFVLISSKIFSEESSEMDQPRDR